MELLWRREKNPGYLGSLDINQPELFESKYLPGPFSLTAEKLISHLEKRFTNERNQVDEDIETSIDSKEEMILGHWCGMDWLEQFLQFDCFNILTEIFQKLHFRYKELSPRDLFKKLNSNFDSQCSQKTSVTNVLKIGLPRQFWAVKVFPIRNMHKSVFLMALATSEG